MGKIKRKYEAGVATRFVSREAAMRKLQISLKDFRRLCILKGIYPREPKNKRKASKGGTTLHTYYALKDIQFLLHEPIINKFREHKVFVKQLKKAISKDEAETAERIREEEPVYSIDHIVKERYPTFKDALRDMDDALCLVAMFARMPKKFKIRVELIQTCRRIMIELMHYIIAAKCLRKVFVSIKGIYYQANIQGETVTWVVQHDRGHQPLSDVDYNVMATFAHFYSVFLRFVNFKLYQSLGLKYPPQIHASTSSSSDDEIIASLGYSLSYSSADVSKEEAVDVDEFQIQNSSSEAYIKAKLEADSVERQKSLFKACKFFLNREVPQEPLAFVIRSCGGTCSWPEESAYGSTFKQDDSEITHEIIDRPSVVKQDLSRWYVQPQWVFDCVNARELLPMEPYYPGALLPPHLSPFVEASGQAIEAERDATMEDAVKDEPAQAPVPAVSASKRRRLNTGKVDEKQVTVSAGQRISEHPQRIKDKAGEQRKLRELMIPKKQKKIYHSLRKSEKAKKKQLDNLERKRKKAAISK